MKVYLIGSLRNPDVPKLAKLLRGEGFEVFDDWMAAGPEADDYWMQYEKDRGHTFAEALKGFAAQHVFKYDRSHLDRCDAGVLLLPAGKSGHLEAGYLIGQKKPVWVLMQGGVKESLSPLWHWLTGLYEGEGTITRNGRRNGHGMQLSITMTDEDVIRAAHQVSGRGSVEGPYFYTTRRTPGPQMRKPKWRWAVRKRSDVLYVLKGFWPGLKSRRQAQARTVLTNAGAWNDFQSAPTPWEARWDVMYGFMSGVFTSEADLLVEMKKADPRLTLIGWPQLELWPSPTGYSLNIPWSDLRYTTKIDTAFP